MQEGFVIIFQYMVALSCELECSYLNTHTHTQVLREEQLSQSFLFQYLMTPCVARD